MARGLSFGTVADRYERYRLDYPAELVDTLLGYAGRPLRSALEVGAGTGKATRVVAARGIHVTAVEPDAAMAAVLREASRGLPVEPMVTTFEGFTTEARFDLVYAAASWHWTDPATRWGRAADLLVPGGVLALFGCPADLADPAVSAELTEVERELVPDDPAVVHAWSLDDMAAAPGLTDCEQRTIGGVVGMPADDFVGRLSTVSAYLGLPPVARAEALRRARAVLPDRVDVDATVTISLARRV